jgi:hypothetical protein
MWQTTQFCLDKIAAAWLRPRNCLTAIPGPGSGVYYEPKPGIAAATVAILSLEKVSFKIRKTAKLFTI